MSNGVHKAAIPCDCHSCGCMLTMRFEPWGTEPEQVYVDFMVAVHHARFRDRLSAAWRVVRGRDPWLHTLAFQDEGLEQLRRALGVPE